MLKRLFTYLTGLKIVSAKEFNNADEFADLYKHVNYETRKEDVKKLINAEDYYLVTNPDKVNPARLLEEADYQFFIFNYLNADSCMYEYIFWTNMTSTHARDIADEVIEWKTAQEDIDWEIRKIL